MGDRAQRTLAALLAADVIGYSALMERDEAATLARLKDLRRRVLEPIIAEHAGRIFKLTGDGMFSTFASVVQATEAALAIQDAIGGDGAEGLKLRIGVHLGDVIIDGDDLYGDGVNLAARLESIAPHGGVCVSASVQEHLSGPLAARFAPAGDRKLKNISRPISTFVWQPESASLPYDAAAPSDATNPDHKPTMVLRAFTASGTEAETLAAAVSDAITTSLSKLTGLVLLESSDAPDYAVAGTIQVRGTRYRTTVHLTDVATRTHVWSQRFDGELGDLFEVEDDLAYRVSSGIRMVLIQLRSEQRGTSPLDQRGTEQLLSEAGYMLLSGDMEEWAGAQRRTEIVLSRSPENFMALSMHALSMVSESLCHYTAVDSARAAAALDMARRAVRLNEGSDFAHTTVALLLHYVHGDRDAAVREIDRALELNPMYAMGTMGRGTIDILGSDPSTGIALCKRAIDGLANSRFVSRTMHMVALGHFVLGDYAEAVEWCRRGEQRSPGATRHLLLLVAAAAHAGDAPLMHDAVAQLLAKHPEITVEAIVPLPFEDPEPWERFTDGLRKAGVPA